MPITGVSSCLDFARTNHKASRGVTVTARRSDPARARMTVSAIGRNIFPSIPVSAKIGTYTRMMMPTARVMGRRTSRPAAWISLSLSSWLMAPFFANRRRMLSTITTEPSTSNPKSMAPRLMRLPESPTCIIPVNAINIDSGMADATITPARRSPRKKNRTAMTRSPPSSRLLRTVRITFETKMVRS